MTRASTRRSMAIALTALLATLPLTSGVARAAVSPADAADATDGPHPPGRVLTVVEFAKAQLRGATPEGPTAAQQSLLAKSSLTHADYEAAMRAMAGCVEQRIPEAKVELYRGEIQPQMFDFSYWYTPADGQKPLRRTVLERTLAQCELAHSAYIQDRWQGSPPPALEGDSPTNVEIHVDVRS